MEIVHNKEKNGIELLFQEEPSRALTTRLKEVGFKPTYRQPLKWYASRHPAYLYFADALKEALATGIDPKDVGVQPSFKPSEENLDHNKFSYVTISYRDGDETTSQSFVVFDPYKAIATVLAKQYAKQTYKSEPLSIDVLPRKYKRKARELLKQGKVIDGMAFKKTREEILEEETTYVVYDSKGRIDSLQISEQKAIDYIARRPAYSQTKMSYEPMPTDQALKRLEEQNGDTEDAPAVKEEPITTGDYHLYFRRFVEEHPLKQVGAALTLEGLQEFSTWLDEQYPNTSQADRSTLKAAYEKWVKQAERTKKRIERLGGKPKVPGPYGVIYQKLLKIAPDFIDHLKKSYTYGRSQSPGFMDLHLDVLYKDEEDKYVIALAHNYEQNGDLIPDPDMQIRIDPQTQLAEALTYQDTFGFKQVYHQKDGNQLVDMTQKRGLNRFLSQWLTNIIKQGHQIVWEEPQQVPTLKVSPEKEGEAPPSNQASSPLPKEGNQSQHELNQAIEAFIAKKDKAGEDYSPHDKDYIGKYAGSGGQIKKGATGKGVLYEYYTDDEIVKKMWGLAIKYGYSKGDVLEPSVGIGNFLKYAPLGARVVGYETNPTTARIAAILYPEAIIINQPFETLFFAGNVHLKDDFEVQQYDLVIGNPPYGEFSGKYAGMGEKKWTAAVSYDQYFITRGLDLLRSEGLLIFIIPSAFLSNDLKYNIIKEKIARKADLIDAYRLPYGVFKTTDIGCDIVVFKRK